MGTYNDGLSIYSYHCNCNTFGIVLLIPTIQLRREDKYDLYGQTLIYTYYYLNCRNVLIHSKCDNRESNRTISMKDFVIDAIIFCTIGLFAISILMIPLYLLGIVS